MQHIAGARPHSLYYFSLWRSIFSIAELVENFAHFADAIRRLLYDFYIRIFSHRAVIFVVRNPQSATQNQNPELTVTSEKQHPRFLLLVGFPKEEINNKISIVKEAISKKGIMGDYDLGLLDDDAYKVEVLRTKMLGIAECFMYRLPSGSKSPYR